MSLQLLRRFMADLAGLRRICGSAMAIRYLWACVTAAATILRDKNLQPADRAMGEGPFGVGLPICRPFRVSGTSVVSGIREMFVRDTYLRGGMLRISDGDLVVDLGANIGNFTNLALAHGPGVRVVAVEPSLAMNKAFTASVGLNQGFLDRTTVVRAFLGARVETIMEQIGDDPNYRDVVWIDEEELIRRGHIETIDFLKCDIEGGEFALLHEGSRLLAMTRCIAAEIHAFAGDVRAFLRTLEACGFEIVDEQWASDGSCTVLAKKV